MSHVTDPRSHGLDSRAPAGQLGVYQLLERIGAGALGQVFRARDTVHGRTVAIKRVPAALTADAARLGLLSRTATNLSRVSHPGVAMLYECGVHDGELFVAHEFVPGQSITTLLGGRPIHPRRAVDLAIEMADALAALHAEQLTHGDLRPDNVIVTPKGHVKLIDAGLAAFTRGGSIRKSAATSLGALTGDSIAVVRYLAPEEASGEGTDARSDLFALGLVLHEMLTGQPAFDRATADDDAARRPRCDRTATKRQADERSRPAGRRGGPGAVASARQALSVGGGVCRRPARGEGDVRRGDRAAAG